MADVVYRSKVRLERIRGTLRRASIPGSEEPVYFGVHHEADHYGVPRGSEDERATTLDYVVAAAAG